MAQRCAFYFDTSLLFSSTETCGSKYQTRGYNQIPNQTTTQEPSWLYQNHASIVIFSLARLIYGNGNQISCVSSMHQYLVVNLFCNTKETGLVVNFSNNQGSMHFFEI